MRRAHRKTQKKRKFCTGIGWNPTDPHSSIINEDQNIGRKITPFPLCTIQWTRPTSLMHKKKAFNIANRRIMFSFNKYFPFELTITSCLPSKGALRLFMFLLCILFSLLDGYVLPLFFFLYLFHPFRILSYI